MKRVILFLIAGLVLASSQFVSAGTQIDPKDSKIVQQPVVEPPCRWTGFYLGVHGGYSFSETSFTELNETDPPYLWDQDGFFGGGQVGYNWQLGSNFVLGLEGTFAGGDFHGSAEINPGAELSLGNVDSNWMATVAGRIGFTCCQNRLLFFVKGGAGFTSFDYHTEEAGGQGEQFNADEDRAAPLVGVGLEYALTCHWSVKLEYNRLFLGSEDVTGIESFGGGGGGNPRTFRADVGDRDTVQMGVNYKF